VLLGSKIPFVLRECQGQQFYTAEDGEVYFDNMEWEIVGPCCIPDLMYGRMMRVEQENEDAPLRPLTVTLV